MRTFVGCEERWGLFRHLSSCRGDETEQAAWITIGVLFEAKKEIPAKIEAACV